MFNTQKQSVYKPSTGLLSSWFHSVWDSFCGKFPYLEVLPDLNTTGTPSIEQPAIPLAFVWIGKPRCKPHLRVTTCLSSFDVSGLGVSPLAGHTLVQYTGSLVLDVISELLPRLPHLFFMILCQRNDMTHGLHSPI